VIQRLAIAAATVLALAGCRGEPQPQSFASPEDAVRALADAAKSDKVEALVALFGPQAEDLIDRSDPEMARRNRQVFAAAAAEGWRLVDHDGGAKRLVVGNEDWPFPVPIVKGERGWRFDAVAGREEVIARRIGRNELSAIQACRAYVMAQRLYARRPHDGRPAGVYAASFRSDAGRENGLYWPAAKGQRRSPLGDLIADAADPRRLEQTSGQQPAPFHGYYYRILTAQGPAAPGGAKDYITAGNLSGGHALIAWPASYDSSGVMTFVVSHEGVVHEKDLGADTDTLARATKAYNPDESWQAVR
jgi:hypothetical protein